MIIIGTILECLYLNFMFTKFKTTYSCNHPLEYLIIKDLGGFFQHPISKTEYSNKICPFGKVAIKYLIFYLLLRMVLLVSLSVDINTIKKINFYILGIALVISLMNMNALLYLIPFFMFDMYMLNRIH